MPTRNRTVGSFGVMTGQRSTRWSLSSPSISCQVRTRPPRTVRPGLNRTGLDADQAEQSEPIEKRTAPRFAPFYANEFARHDACSRRERMPLHILGDPRQPIGRWVLDACAKVTRESPDQADYVGLLMSEPELGAPLVLALDDRQRLTTSRIQRIEPGPDDTVYVHTENSRYWVRRLSQVGRSR